MLTTYFSPLKDTDIIKRSIFILINFISSRVYNPDQKLTKMFSKSSVLKNKDKSSRFLHFWGDFRLISMVQLRNRQSSDRQMSSTIYNALV